MIGEGYSGQDGLVLVFLRTLQLEAGDAKLLRYFIPLRLQMSRNIEILIPHSDIGIRPMWLKYNSLEP